MLFCQVNFVLYVSNSKEYNYAHTYLHMCTFRCRRCTPIYSRTFQDSPAHCERQERPSIQQYSSTVLISLSIFLSLSTLPPAPPEKIADTITATVSMCSCECLYMYVQAHQPNLPMQTEQEESNQKRKYYLSIGNVCMCMYICRFVILCSGNSKIIFRVRKRRSVFFCPRNGADTYMHHTYQHTYIHLNVK
jgi:hypothetical protein